MVFIPGDRSENKWSIAHSSSLGLRDDDSNVLVSAIIFPENQITVNNQTAKKIYLKHMLITWSKVIFTWCNNKKSEPDDCEGNSFELISFNLGVSSSKRWPIKILQFSRLLE